MNLANDSIALHQTTWNKYRSNMPRHLMGVSRYLQSKTMHTLTEQQGHSSLRLSFEPFISLLSEKSCRLTELAARLKISKQSCKQTTAQIEKAGYIQRINDPSDGRAKILALTRRGQKLIEQGSQAAASVLDEFTAISSDRCVSDLSELLAELTKNESLPAYSQSQENSILLAVLLPRISDHITHRLMQLTIAKGHLDLKLSYGQVLSLIGLDGGRIQQIAAIQAVSKQAISAIATELENLGYIFRAQDPNDARQRVLMLSDKGWSLLADSVAAIDELEKEFTDIIGRKKLQQLKITAAELYNNLQLETEIFSPATDLNKLAHELFQQLGQQRSNELAQLLTMIPTEVIR